LTKLKKSIGVNLEDIVIVWSVVRLYRMNIQDTPLHIY